MNLYTAVEKVKAAFSGQTEEWWKTTYAEFADGRRVYDINVAKHAKKHLSFMDRFSMQKVASAVLASFSILSGAVDEPNKKNWKYFRDF